MSEEGKTERTELETVKQQRDALARAVVDAQREVKVQRQVCAEQLAEIAELKARSVRAEHANKSLEEAGEKVGAEIEGLRADLAEARTVAAARKVVAKHAQGRKAPARKG